MSVEQARKALNNMMEKKQTPFFSFAGKVVSVQEAKGTCTVAPVNGSPNYFGVRLVPSADNVIDGVIPIPAVGGYVICGKLGNENNAYIQVPGEIDKYIIKTKDGGTVELNGKQYSMVKAEVLETELKKLKASVDLIKSAIESAAVVPLDGGAAFKTNIIAALAIYDSGNFDNIKNEKVKHG